MHLGQWEHSGLRFEGLSLAGVRTSITLPQFSLCFDVAQGLPHAIPINTFLITHGHMDHASGIPYLISQKAMSSHKPPRFFMPHSMVEPLTEIMQQWSKIEGFTYEFEFIGCAPGDEIFLKSNLYLSPFETVHRVPSQGYSLYRRSKKLRRDLVGKSSQELSQLRARGEEMTSLERELLVSFTGDTQIEFLDRSPEVLESKILFLEATYLDERKPISSAKEWGHTHLDEIIPRLSSIKSEKIVLIHSSARYSAEEALHLLHQKLPAQERERVVLFPGR